jgi:hypothetical protein
MTAPNKLISDREAFRELAKASGSAAGRGDSEAANAHTIAGNAIVLRWVVSGQVLELLDPLLEDPSAEVRFAAASHLLHHGAIERAFPVLEAIDEADRGMVAPMAGLVLRKWRKTRGQQIDPNNPSAD